MGNFHNYISSSTAELNGELGDVLDLIFNASQGKVGDLSSVTNRLFRGYNGLGTNYMILCKAP